MKQREKFLTATFFAVDTQTEPKNFFEFTLHFIVGFFKLIIAYHFYIRLATFKLV